MSESRVFFSRHRKCGLDIPDENHPGGRLPIKFKPNGAVGMYTAKSDEEADKMRDHPMFMKGTRGGFYQQKPAVPEVMNIVRGTKGAGTVAKEVENVKN